MWTLTVRSPDSKPSEYLLKPGINSLGRRQDNDILISDEAASRLHAQIFLDENSDTLTIRDLGSRNGTFINRRRLTESFDFKLSPNDVVRIGLYELLVTQRTPSRELELAVNGLQPYSRELLLESFDNHAVLLYEVIQQLNNILDIDVALKEVSRLLQVTLGADKCQVILAEDFPRLEELGFPRAIAQTAIDQRSAILLPSQEPQTRGLLESTAQQLNIHTVLCVPVISNEKPLALIYLFKTRKDTRYFGQRDMQLAVAVSHLAALTIERVSLMERVREEQRIRQLLQRFVAPVEAEFLLRSYLDTGNLPQLTEQRLTILFVDIAGSNGLAERLGARVFGELLERYYQDITDIIFQYGGLLDKYLGDGVMAIFGMSGKSEPEVKAVEAALEILRQIEGRYRGEPRNIDIGIGINTGNALAGYVSTKERVELTVVGDAVNVAAGLETLARPNRILLGPQTAAAVQGRFQMHALGELHIKDRTQPVAVTEVLPH